MPARARFSGVCIAGSRVIGVESSGESLPRVSSFDNRSMNHLLYSTGSAYASAYVKPM